MRGNADRLWRHQSRFWRNVNGSWRNASRLWRNVNILRRNSTRLWRNEDCEEMQKDCEEMQKDREEMQAVCEEMRPKNRGDEEELPESRWEREIQNIVQILLFTLQPKEQRLMF